MQRALSRLTRRERAVVILRYYEDLSEASIARELLFDPDRATLAIGATA